MEFRLLRTLRLGLKSLMLHKLRSGLTALGIVFGVCSVIAMLAIGEGTTYLALQRIKGLGATNIIVRSIKPVTSSSNTDSSSRVLDFGLKMDDYERIRTTVPTLTEVLPIWELRKEIRHNHNNLDGRIVATTPAYQSINRLEMHRGRFLNPTDMQRRENIVVLAYEVAEKLFPVDDPLSQAVRVWNDFYRVVGVCKSRAPTAAIGGSLSGQEYDKDVYIPLSTARMRFGETQIDVRGGQMTWERTELTQVTLTVDSVDKVEPTANVVRDLVALYHPKPDYGVVVPLELLKQAEDTKRMLNWVFGSVGAISLLVGGIGIMNIMLATVTERTREIGIRRALGAKRRDITIQFLVETVVLSSVGGLLGVGLGVGLAYILEQAAAALGFTLPTVSMFSDQRPFRWDVAIATGILLSLSGLSVSLVRIAHQGVSLPLLVEGFGLLLGGATLGLLFGVGLPFMITDFLGEMMGNEDRVPAIIPTWSLPLAFGISVAIGIFFGLYPARRAAMMDPIEALRHD